MTVSKRAELVVRETILKMLSSEEVARVSTAESASRLSEGEEYLDLEHLDQGVQRAQAATKVPMGQVRSGQSDRVELPAALVGLVGEKEAKELISTQQSMLDQRRAAVESARNAFVAAL